jgi:hypothetical protein
MAFGVCATSAAASTRTTPRCRASTGSSRSTSTSRLPAAPGDGHRRDHAAAGQDRAGRHPIVNGFLMADARGPRHPSAATRPESHAARIEHGLLVVEVAVAACRSCWSRPASSPTFASICFLDVTAIDWPARTPRFEVVYHFYSTRHKVRVRAEDRGDGGRPDGRLADVPLYGSAASWNANATTCTASCSAATPTCARSCSTKASSATRCARTTRSCASSRSCPTGRP